MQQLVEDQQTAPNLLPKHTPLAYSRIRAVQSHIEGDPVSSADLEVSLNLEERFGIETGTLEQLTGIKTRYLVDHEKVKPHELAHSAAVDALDQADIDPESLDVIIFASVARDYTEPSTAHLVQEKLGAANAFVFDISNACLGIMNGILVLDSLIAAGRCRTGLVCGGEIAGPCVDATSEKIRQAKSAEELYLLFAALTIGDAGAAIVLEPKQGDEPERGFVAFEFASHGEHHDVCVIPALSDKPMMETDSSRLIEEGSRIAVDVLDRLLEKSNWTRDDIDLVIPHQVSRPANLKTICERCGIPEEKMVMTLGECGNTGSTALPLALAKAVETGRLEPGMKVWLAGIGSGISHGFASMVW